MSVKSLDQGKEVDITENYSDNAEKIAWQDS